MIRIAGVYSTTVREVEREIKTKHYKYVDAEMFCSIYANALVYNRKLVKTWRQELYLMNKANRVKAEKNGRHGQPRQPLQHPAPYGIRPITSNLGGGFSQVFLKAHPQKMALLKLIDRINKTVE